MAFLLVEIVLNLVVKKIVNVLSDTCVPAQVYQTFVFGLVIAFLVVIQILALQDSVLKGKPVITNQEMENLGIKFHHFLVK